MNLSMLMVALAVLAMVAGCGDVIVEPQQSGAGGRCGDKTCPSGSVCYDDDCIIECVQETCTIGCTYVCAEKGKTGEGLCEGEPLSCACACK